MGIRMQNQFLLLRFCFCFVIQLKIVVETLILSPNVIILEFTKLCVIFKTLWQLFSNV